MGKNSNFFKRAQTWVLTFALVLTVFQPILGFVVTADDSTTNSMTDGKIVSLNYDLTDGEIELIGSGLLVGDTHEYKVPTADDNLISVDTDNKTVTVETYEGTSGYIWKPVSVKIMVGDAEKETVSLDGSGKGTYSFDGNAFSVLVDYQIDIEVNADVQETLLNAPAYLVQAFENMDDIAAAGEKLAMVSEILPELKRFVTGVSYGSSAEIKFGTNAANSTNALLAQIENNKNNGNGEKLDLEVMIEEYEASSSKSQYLIENGDAFRAKVVETQEYLDYILNDAGLASVQSTLNMIKSYFYGTLSSTEKAELDSAISAIGLAVSAFNSAVNALEAPCADPWIATTVTLVKSGLTDAEYTALDTLVITAGEVAMTDVSGIAIKNPLVAQTVKVQHNLSMFDVTVKVVLNTTQGNAVKEYASSAPVVVTLAKDATKAEILAAVAATGIEADSLASWASAYIDGKFEASYSSLPATLTEDITYTITYSPKEFAVDQWGTVNNYPYGYVLTLENHANGEKAYDYTVDGTYYAQGSAVIVTKDITITRKEGKSYKNADLYDIISENYLSTAKGQAILTSGALKHDEVISVRYPDNSNNIVTLTGSTLKAVSYPSSYKGLDWVAYSYTLQVGGADTNTYKFNGVDTVVISESFDYVKVNYRLELTNFADADILEKAQLPDVLAAEAKGQLSALNSFAGKKSTLTQITSTVLNTMMLLVDGNDGDDAQLNADDAKNALLKACFYDALNGIKNECMTGGALNLTTLIDEYTNSSDGLRYYYQNSGKFINEFTVLSEYLKEMLGDDADLTADEKLNGLKALILKTGVVPEADVEDYIKKFTNINDLVNDVLNNLKAPHEIIDVNSANLGKLTTALQQSGSTDNIASLSEKLHLTDSTIGVAASDKLVLSVTVEVQGGTNFTVTSNSILIDDKISSTVIGQLIDDIQAKLDEQGLVEKYYETTYSKAELEALIGTTATSSTVSSYNYSYTYKNFTVSVPGMADQTVNKGDLQIALTPSADSAVRYDYYIDGVKVTDALYTLTAEQFDKLVNGTLVITRTDVDVLGEDLVDYVNSLNANAGEGVVFALVENGGTYSIVMKIDGTGTDAVMNAVMGTATGIMMGSYPYVGIDGEGFLDDGKIYLQSIVDALMNSGFGNQTILDVMDANGNINNISLSGNVVSAKPLTTYGGKLMATTMELGPDSASAFSVPFYVTLGAASAEMVDTRNALDGQVTNNFNLVCENGKANLNLNLPAKAYEGFLAVLLVTEKIDMANISAVNSQIAIEFFNDLLIPVLSQNGVTVTTFDNTLSKFGFALDLASKKGADALYNTMVEFYTGATFTYNEKTGTMNGVLDISDAIDALNLGALSGVIAEKNTGLEICIALTIEDLGSEYEALVVDINASGITNKAGLTNDLASKLSEIEGTASIVLLDDINADLVFETTTLLNLNGFTVTGDITGDGKVIIVDSNLADSNVGTVDGDISGNVIIVGGKYTNTVTDFVKAGYVQNADGVVVNEFYSISEDASGNVSIEIDAGLINTDSMPSMAGLVLEIACDLLFNGYTTNYLEIAGYTVYDITAEDFVGIYSDSNRVDSVIEEVLGLVDTADLSALINLVLDDSFDFTAISEAIANGDPVLSYEMVTKPWSVEFSHNTAEDYITGSLVSGEPGTTGSISIFVTGTDEEKTYASELFAELGETTTADINVTLEHGKNGKEIFLNASADVDVFSDLTDPAYAVMFSVIIADGIGAPANEGLVDGIKKYYETDNMAYLTVEFNKLTTAQVITALKNLGVDDEFTVMVADLGLDTVIGSEVAELEELYDRIGKLSAAAVRKADLTGGNRTLDSFVDSDGAYGMTRSNVEKLVDKVLLKGYTAIADVEVTDFYVGAKLFEEGTIPLDPEFIDGTGTPEILDSDKVVGSKVDVDNGLIILDTVRGGITVAELRDIILFNAKNTDTIEVIIGDGTLADDALVSNGTVVTAIASNALSLNTDEVKYTVIILGDVNCNGRIDVGDATLISRNKVGDYVFTENQGLAADVNCNGGTDVADAVKITRKIVYWDEYTSSLNK